MNVGIAIDQQIDAVELFQQLGQVTCFDGRAVDQKSLQDVDILLIRSVTRVDKHLLANTSVRLVASLTSGTDHVDNDYLQQVGIQFVYAGGSNACSVAEYVLSCLCVLAEHTTFDHKTVGIIGCGHVGSQVSKFLDVLNIPYLKNDPPLQAKNHAADYVDLETLLAQSDIVSLHVSLNKSADYSSYHIINKDTLSMMKRDAVLINTSRGEVIDEVALIEHKTAHHNFNYICDVWDNEPNINLKLLALSMIATPHIAGYSQMAKQRAIDMIYQVVAKFVGRMADNEGGSFVSQNIKSITLAQGDVCDAILASYDVRKDDALLRCFQPDEVPPFDQLRSQYPLRLEFGEQRLSGIKAVDKKKLQGLGFHA